MRQAARMTIAIGAGVAVLSAGAPHAAQMFGPAPLDARQPIAYFVAQGSEDTGFRPGDRELAEWAVRAWERSARAGVTLVETPEREALVRLYWAGPNDGQYGEMRPFMLGGRRGAAVFVRPDMAALGPDIADRTRRDSVLRDTIVYLTCLHELGHAFGLPHTRAFADIMFFFGDGGDIAEYFGRYRSRLRGRADIVRVSGLSPADEARMQSLYPARP